MFINFWPFHNGNCLTIECEGNLVLALNVGLFIGSNSHNNGNWHWKGQKF